MITGKTYSPEDDDAARGTWMFSEWINGIQRQIDQMNERISKLEHEREATTPSTKATHSLPDSNGFWRDAEGDIWAYDGDPDHQPIYLYDNDLKGVCNNPPDVQFTWESIAIFAPFTKISNPFTAGDDHAD